MRSCNKSQCAKGTAFVKNERTSGADLPSDISLRTSSDISSSISVVSVPLEVTGEGPTMSLGLIICVEYEEILCAEFGRREAESVGGGGEELGTRFSHDTFRKVHHDEIQKRERTQQAQATEPSLFPKAQTCRFVVRKGSETSGQSLAREPREPWLGFEMIEWRRALQNQAPAVTGCKGMTLESVNSGDSTVAACGFGGIGSRTQLWCTSVRQT